MQQTEKGTRVDLPEGGTLRLTITEADGTPAEVDLREYAGLLLDLGGPTPEPGGEAEGSADLGYLEASDDVTFYVEGAELAPEAALERIGRGLVEVLREAVRDTPAA